jgi:hypothetical protein
MLALRNPNLMPLAALQAADKPQLDELIEKPKTRQRAERASAKPESQSILCGKTDEVCSSLIDLRAQT